MARALWKGTISFGLVTIPVAMYSATEEKSVRFHQLRAADGARIRYQKVAEGQEDAGPVPPEEIIRGYEVGKGRYVTFADDELAELHGESSRTIDIVAFVPLAEVDPIYYRKSYYLGPEDEGALKAYRLLAETLAESGLVALCRMAIREKQYVATLRLRDAVFVLETMFWPDEIRVPDVEGAGRETEITEAERAMARQLVEATAGHFEPERFHDETRERILAAVDAKLAGEAVLAPAAAPAGKIVDLMEALQASVARARAREGRDDRQADTGS